MRSIKVISSIAIFIIVMHVKAGYKLPDNYELYFRAEENLRNQNLENALSLYQEFFKSRPNSDLIKEVYPKMAEEFYSQKKFKIAQEVLANLLNSKKKQVRRLGIKRPQVLSLFLQTQIKLNQSINCKIVSELFSDFPEYKSVANWTSIMSKNELIDHSIPCEVDVDLIRTRIKNLLWRGLFQKADLEIAELEQQTRLEKFEIDWLKSVSLSHQGQVQNALELILPFYKTKNKNEEFLYHLGLLATRAGHLNLAIYIYDELAELYSNHKSKIKAIHQSALTCYQFGDYDCAFERWQKIKNFGNFKSMQKEVSWYLPWIKYLRGQYVEAELDFAKLLDQAYMKSQESKIIYWLAKSKIKNNKQDDAKVLFTKLVNKIPVSYYSHLASFELGLKKKRDFLSSSKSENLTNISKDDLSSSSESLSLEVNAESGFVKENDESDEDNENNVVVETKDLDEKLNKLQQMLNDGNRMLVFSELRLMESHVNEIKDLQKLASFYLKNNFYQRSSYIGQIYLTANLNLQQQESSKSHLKLAFPNAFDDYVTKEAQSTQIPRALVWGIMKAESQFNEQAVSVVGARGLMQLMPFTADRVNSKILQKRDFASDDLFLPQSSIQIGTRYLQNLNNKFLDQPALTAAAYNAGPHRVQNWSKYFGYLSLEEFVEHIPFSETRNYVKKVTSHLQVYDQLYDENEKSNYSMIGPIKYNYKGPHVLKEEW